MKLLKLTCNGCKKQFEKLKKEFDRQVRLGKSNFYCSNTCCAKYTTPKRIIHKNINRNCLFCKSQFISSTHKHHKKCCSTECAKKYSQSKVDYRKVSSSLKNLVRKKSEKLCSICNKFFGGKYTKYCSVTCYELSRLKIKEGYEQYKNECKFKFNLKDYPDEFDFSLIEKYGWYKPKNRGNNLYGVSRDHIISIKWGFDNNVDSRYICHPANCQLLLHGDNVRKGKNKSITLDELKKRISRWEEKYGLCGNEGVALALQAS